MSTFSLDVVAFEKQYHRNMLKFLKSEVYLNLKSDLPFMVSPNDSDTASYHYAQVLLHTYHEVNCSELI